MKAGALLIEAKRLVAHGEWLDWLRDNCTVKVSTAQAYMQVARELPAKLEEYDKSLATRDLGFEEARALIAGTTQPAKESYQAEAGDHDPCTPPMWAAADEDGAEDMRGDEDSGRGGDAVRTRVDVPRIPAGANGLPPRVAALAVVQDDAARVMSALVALRAGMEKFEGLEAHVVARHIVPENRERWIRQLTDWQAYAADVVTALKRRV
jgi:hypothetical protein